MNLIRLLVKIRDVRLSNTALIVITALYVILPFDVILDIIPVFGQADDAMVVLSAVSIIGSRFFSQKSPS